jgi:hypothetical protein
MSEPARLPIYFSNDIEADGPIPGQNSMLSCGFAAFTLDPSEPNGGHLIETWTANLELIEGAVQDPDTMKWWMETPEKRKAYAQTRVDLKTPEAAMLSLATWVEKLTSEHKGKATYVGYPATYDFLFTYWYLQRFAQRSPFGFQGFDMKTAAAIKLDIPFHKVGKRDMPEAWKGPEPHTHLAVDDAIEQGWMFCRMMKWKKPGSV